MSIDVQFIINSYLQLARLTENKAKRMEYMKIAENMLQDYSFENLQEAVESKDTMPLIDIIRSFAKDDKVINVSYDEICDMYGVDVFCGYQPKRMIDGVKPALWKENISLVTGKTVKYQGRTRNGFAIIKTTLPSEV